MMFALLLQWHTSFSAYRLFCLSVCPSVQLCLCLSKHVLRLILVGSYVFLSICLLCLWYGLSSVNSLFVLSYFLFVCLSFCLLVLVCFCPSLYFLSLNLCFSVLTCFWWYFSISLYLNYSLSLLFDCDITFTLSLSIFFVSYSKYIYFFCLIL